MKRFRCGRHAAFAALTVSVWLATPAGQGAPHSRAEVELLLAAGSYAQAEVVARAAVNSATGIRDAESLDAASAADGLVAALVMNGRATDAGTLTLAERTLADRETALDPRDPALVDSLLNLGDVLTARGEPDRAIALLQRAVTLSEQSGAAGYPGLVVALDRLGRSLIEARRLDQALALLQRSLALAEERQAGDALVARILEDIALTLQHQGAYPAAGERLARAQSLRAASRDHPEYVATLNLVAQQRWFEGDLIASRDASDLAVALAERTLRADHPIMALSLRLLAATLYDLGDTAGSIETTRRALSIAERSFGANHHITAEYVNDLGIVELDEGNYESARALLRRALALHESRYGGTHDFVAGTLNGLARADARLGDYAEASREQSRAIAIYEQVGGTGHPFVALSLARLAAVYNDEGRPSRALPLLQRALAIREASLGPNHRDVARTLADLAITLAALGRLIEAQRLALRALNIWEGIDTPEAPELATVLALYADLQARRGDFVAARDYYARALTVRGKVFGPAHPLSAETQTGLATALAELGDGEGALHAAGVAEASGREHLQLMLRSLPERQALKYAVARPKGLDLIYSLALSTPAAVPLAADGMVRGRALVLDEIAARRSALGSSDDRLAESRTAMTSAQQRLANLLVRGPGSMTAVQYAALVDRARAESEAAEQALAEKSAAFRAERRRAQVGLEQVLEGLPADAALLSFVRYDRRIQIRSAKLGVPPSSASRAPARPVPSYLAFVLRAGQPAVAVPVGTVQAIDALVTQWRADLVSAATAPTPTTTSERASGVALRRQIWDRVAPHLGNAKLVFIVPEGTLGLVPFAALPVGERSYLIDRGPVVHYLSAERDLVAPALASPSPSGLLAVGGPSFNDASLFASRGRTVTPAPTRTAAVAPTLRGTGMPCVGLQQIAFEPLGGTRQEVRDVSGVWNSNVSTTTGQAQVLIGRDASEMAFKRDAAGHRVLHLATHGFFLSGDCAVAPSGTRGVGGLSTGGPQRQSGNPLLLSGLALAGANRRSLAGPDEDDGILTAEEVASLDLEWRRVGGAVSLRHRRRPDSGRRRRLRLASRLPGRRRAHRRDEPVVGGRSGDPRLDEGALRGPVPAQAVDRRCRASGEPHRAARSARQGPQHASVLLGRVRRRRRLAVARELEFIDRGEECRPRGNVAGPARAGPAA